MRQRPENFIFDYSSSLARGLVFAGLAGGNCRGSKAYYDSSSRKNHGQLTNMDPATDWTWVPELKRWGLDFDGGNDYVTLSGSWSFGTGDISLSAWASFGAANSYTEGIIGRYPGLADGTWYLGREVGGFPCLHFGLSGAGLVKLNSSVSNTDGSWHHISFSRSGTSYTLYVDGAVAASDTRTANNWGSTAPYIGRMGSSAGDYFDGNVSDPLIHSRALTPSEIQQLADPSNVSLSGLIRPPKRKYYAITYSPTTARFLFLKQNNKFLSFTK